MERWDDGRRRFFWINCTKMVQAALFALLALPAARGALRVERGPPSILGLEVPAVSYAFSASSAAVTAPAALFRRAEWSVDCPPRYQGSASIAGAILVVTDTIFNAGCSFEQRALGAKLAGAAAWVTALSEGSFIALFAPVPGWGQNVWNAGDSRALRGIVAADARSRESALIVASLEAGAQLQLALVPSSDSQYSSVLGSRGFRFWTVVLALHCAAVLELALCRSWAFARADGGLRASRQQALLWLEILAVLARALVFVCDPFQSSGLFDFATSLSLVSAQFGLGALSSAVFLVLFCEAISITAVCDFRLAQLGWRRAFLGVAFAGFGADVASSVLIMRFNLGWLMLLKLAALLLLVPALLFGLSVAAYYRTRVGLASSRLSSAHMSRWVRRLYQSNVYTLLRICAGLAVPWALFGPVRQVVVFALGLHALNAAAYVHIDVVRPLYERVPVGPFRRLTNAIHAAVSLALEPKAPPIDSSSLAAKANIQPALELYTRAHRRGSPLRSVVAQTVPIDGASPAPRLGSGRAHSSGDAIVGSIRRTGGRPNSFGASARLVSAGDSASPSPPLRKGEVRLSSGSRPSNGGGGMGMLGKLFVSRLQLNSVPDVSPATDSTSASGGPMSAPGSIIAPRRAQLGLQLGFFRGLRRGSDPSSVDGASVPSSLSPTPIAYRRGGAGAGVAFGATGAAASASALEAGVRKPPPDSMLLGISLPGLRAFLAEKRVDERAQTHEVRTLLRKMTAEADSQRSYVEMHHMPGTGCAPRRAGSGGGAQVAPQPQQQQPHLAARIGRANILVVHTHLRPFGKLLEALAAHVEVHSLDERATFFWIDCFCVRALHAQEVAQVMGEVARQVGSVLLVLEPWNRPVCLRRSWCLYELACAKAAGVRVHATVTREARAELRADMHTDQHGAARILEVLVPMVDVRSSLTSVDKDKQMLLALARRDAPDVSGDEVLKRLNGDVVAVMRQALESLVGLVNLEPMTSSSVRPLAGRQNSGGIAGRAEEVRRQTMAELEVEVNARIMAVEVAQQRTRESQASANAAAGAGARAGSVGSRASGSTTGGASLPDTRAAPG